MPEGGNAQADQSEPDPGEAFLQPVALREHDLQDHEREQKEAGGIGDILPEDDDHVGVERCQGEDGSQQPACPGGQAVFFQQADAPGDGETQEKDLGNHDRGRGEPDPGDQPHREGVKDRVVSLNCPERICPHWTFESVLIMPGQKVSRETPHTATIGRV